ncbi:MAG: tetratricopeptide repeat protein [Bacteroidota bacterium]
MIKKYCIMYLVSPWLASSIKYPVSSIFLLIALNFLYCFQTYAENTKLDSLLNELKAAKHDTTRIKLNLKIGNEFEYNIPDSAFYYYYHGLKIAEKIKNKIFIARCLNYIGNVHINQGNYAQAIEYYQKSLKIKKELGDKKGVSRCYNNIGGVHHYQGNYVQAIEYYQKSLKIKEELGDKKGMSACYNNIGIIHRNQGNYSQAIEYYQKSLKIKEELSDKKGISYCYGNIGVVHLNQGNYAQAIEYYQKSLKIKEELSDKNGMSACYNNIGLVHIHQDNYSEAIKYLTKSLNIFEEYGNLKEIATVNNNIASLYIKRNEYNKALKYAEKGLKIAKEIKAMPEENNSYKYLSEIYDSMRNSRKALEYYKLHTTTKDSLFNAEKNKQITEMETRYQTEKKQKEIELLNKEKEVKNLELKKKDAEVKKQKIMIYSFIFGIIFILIFLVLLYRQYRSKKKFNIILAEKNKDITDSIMYAKRIQVALLPPEKYITPDLPEHFVLFKPKDIVSGDFHWYRIKNNKLIIAVADCTGHGVPGAFLSILGITFLNEIADTGEEMSLHANEILNQLRENVINALSQTGKEVDQSGYSLVSQDSSGKSAISNQVKDGLPSDLSDEANAKAETSVKDGLSSVASVKDGMDIALCVLDLIPKRDTVLNRGTHTLQFSGAMNPLYLIRNNELTEIKGDRMPIGIHHLTIEPFTNNEKQLQKGDTIYIFSDGYADQFGGDKGKKYRYKPFKQLLVSIQDKSMEEQKAILDRTFEEWKGDLEQIDDVCMVGIRI